MTQTSRYQIHSQHAPGRFPITGKHRIERGGGCINCGKCIQLCVYGVHTRRPDDIRKMDVPDFDKCMNCFACVQDCTANVLTMDMNPAFQELGDGLYTPESITSLMRQAETGTIPVFGAGYGGAFAGEGFDAMWTDMSEIVRPTRDGIHGREAISTSVDLGRHPYDVLDLRFDDDGNPITKIPATIEIKLPLLFNRMPFVPESPAIRDALMRAAAELGTLVMLDETAVAELPEIPRHIVVHVGARRMNEDEIASLARRANIVELDAGEHTLGTLKALKAANPHVFVFVRVPVAPGFEDLLESMATVGAEVLHLDAGPYREGIDPVDLGLPDAVAGAHRRLVERGIRDMTTLIVSGGVVGAEHVAKSIILGADAVALDLPLLIALECDVCKECALSNACPRELEAIDPTWGKQRIVNLIGSWRNQLLEVLGAMGLRDVCRLRGETGRAIFRRDLDREIFEPIFGRRHCETLAPTTTTTTTTTEHVSATHGPPAEGDDA